MPVTAIKHFIVLFIFSLSWRPSYASELKEFVSPFTQETYQVSVISEQQLENLFKYLSSRKSIPFDIIIDGCYARAYLMNTAAALKGYSLAKRIVEVVNKDTETIIIPSQDQKWRLRWYYHVAPIVYVRLNSGEVVERVIDPSLFDKAVSSDDFLHKLSKNNLNVKLDTFILPKYVSDKDQLLSKVNMRKLDLTMLGQLAEVKVRHSQGGNYGEKIPYFDQERQKWYLGGWEIETPIN